jgi:uncharacterized heparinase superfamily protein
MTQLGMYLHTIRHLKPRQITSRVTRRRGPSRIELPTGKIVFNESVAMAPVAEWPSTELGQKDFCFLGETKSFDLDSMNWASMEKSKLWRYNLHYFDFLRDEWRTSETRAWLIDSWIVGNPPSREDAWEPFPISLRIVNWIKHFLRLETKNAIKGEWLRSLYEQALWLDRNIEYHLLANHLFKNAKALVFAGLFFSGDDASRWLDKGMSILKKELPEQILPDGGHFERSPMYHSMILEDCLDLLNVASRREDASIQGLEKELRDTTRSMTEFLSGMTLPDGQIALFNDAAFGIEAEPRNLFDYYERITGEKIHPPKVRMWSFPDTGYYVMAPKDGDRLIIDCGKIGPDYQPGHSHCDTLSFELSLKGTRVIVDSGCYGYEEGFVRQYNRGNAGHNTLTIDGQNQSEVWASHRCARRAYPLYAKLEENGIGEIIFEGAHNGYRRLPGKPIHHRSFRWAKNEILIEDVVEGGKKHTVELSLHINPDLKLEMNDNRAVIRDGEMVVARIAVLETGEVNNAEGWYCPEFGLRRQCTVLTAKYENVSLPFHCGWRIIPSSQT